MIDPHERIDLLLFIDGRRNLNLQEKEHELKPKQNYPQKLKDNYRRNVFLSLLFRPCYFILNILIVRLHVIAELQILQRIFVSAIHLRRQRQIP